MQTKEKIKQKYELKNGNHQFNGTSFTIAAKREISKRDLRRMAGSIFSKIGIVGSECLIAADGIKSKSYHFVMSIDLTQQQLNQLQIEWEIKRQSLNLGMKAYFYKHHINNAFFYSVAHEVLDILRMVD